MNRKIGISQKHLFSLSLCKIQLFSFGFEKGNLKMSQECDLSEFMIWHIIGVVDHGRSASDALGIARSVVQGCEINFKTQRI